MRQYVIESLADRYKKKMTAEMEKELEELFSNLQIEEGEYSVSLIDFGKAVYRFIARCLQSGFMDDQKKIMEYIPYREDFWPKDFEEYMLGPLMQSATLT